MDKRKSLKCKRCGWKWMSSIDPKVCPKCHLDWRVSKDEIVMQGSKINILNYLEKLKRYYGEAATVDEVIQDFKKNSIEM